jgi:diguanylate cyclase (GGDEF)-like protein
MRKIIERIVVISLLLITAFIYFMQQYSWNKSFTIDATSAFEINAISDISVTNGKSISSYRIEDDKIILSCEIIASDYTWPFCELTFQFHDPHSINNKFGIDLSSFDTVTIDANYTNIAPQGIRFQLRNFNPAYSNLKDESSLKYNAVEYFLYGKTNKITIPLESLQVASWWLFQQKLPMKYAAPELENIMVLELATGNGMQPGHYTIELNNIVFQGKRFTTENVYLGLISLWILTTLFFFFYHLFQGKHLLLKAQKKLANLTRLNKLLNVQSANLQKQVDRDPLTGALNRVGIKAVLIEDIPILSIAFIDIDHFKNINDTLGHAAGDDILKEFSQLLYQNSRDTDFLARWGGEEFLLICPNTPLGQMEILAEAIRKLIEDYEWPHNIKLTSSFGIAQKGNESNADFIARTDKAMYMAKGQGRNKVVISHN